MGLNGDFSFLIVTETQKNNIYRGECSSKEITYYSTFVLHSNLVVLILIFDGVVVFNKRWFRSKDVLTTHSNEII